MGTYAPRRTPHPSPGHKTCRECKSIKPFSEFNKSKTNWDKMSTCCRTCGIAALRNYRQRPEWAAQRKSYRDPDAQVRVVSTFPTPETKTCVKCRQELPFTSFYKVSGTKASKDRLSGKCKECKRAREREYGTTPKIRATKQRWRNSPNGKTSTLRLHLRTRFGLSMEGFLDLEQQQKKACAICGQKNGRRRLAVDHSHVTGQIRGLLCTPCNQGLGMFRDDPVRLEQAKQYLLRNLAQISE